MSKNRKYENVQCPCTDCKTAFRGTKLQIANNFNTHYIGAHIKIDNHCTIDVNKKERLSKIISEETTDSIVKGLTYEPAFTSEDESTISLENDCETISVYDLSKYLAENPVCREERQFALFFANKLKENDPKIKNVLIEAGILKNNDVIIEVFYEVTFLRDYWLLDKTGFNQKLMDYVLEDITYIDAIFNEACGKQEVDTGQEKNNHANYWSPTHYIAKWMMNAKPDIGLIIKNKNIYNLSFIECKYSSNAVKYRNENLPEGLKQTDLQNLILDFLCKKIEVIYEGKAVQKGDVFLARFINGNSKQEECEIEIPINLLIS